MSFFIDHATKACTCYFEAKYSPVETLMGYPSPLQSPKFYNKKAQYDSSHPPVRYHICRNCGRKFKIVEQ